MKSNDAINDSYPGRTKALPVPHSAHALLGGRNDGDLEAALDEAQDHWADVQRNIARLQRKWACQDRQRAKPFQKSLRPHPGRGGSETLTTLSDWKTR
jgi:hypothetical protein